MLILGQLATPNSARAVDIIAQAIPNLRFNTFADLVSLFLRLTFWLAGFILFVGAIYAGIRIMGSGGSDPKAFETNKQMLTNSIIGFILVISAVAIIKVIETITGIQIIG